MTDAKKSKTGWIVGGIIAAVLLVAGAVWWNRSKTAKKKTPVLPETGPSRGDTKGGKKDAGGSTGGGTGATRGDSKGGKKVPAKGTIIAPGFVLPAKTGPDPTMPAANPTLGKFYAVEKGDIPMRVLADAGVPQAKRYRAWLAMTNHALNAWIGTDNKGAGGKAFNPQLRWYKRFENVDKAFTGKPYTYKGTWRDDASASYVWPVVYLPAEGDGW